MSRQFLKAESPLRQEEIRWLERRVRDLQKIPEGSKIHEIKKRRRLKGVKGALNRRRGKLQIL